MPARHANVIKSHKQVIKETTFLPEDDNKIDKDKATREALAILEKEYEIFNDPNMLPVKALPRYDTWDRDLTPQQWLEYCGKRPEEPHAVSPCFDKGEYAWKPVQILGYDEKERKFKVRVLHNGQEKTVTRLSLLFYAEDPELFRERVEMCKMRQKHVEQELRFTDLVDSIPPDAVSILSKERREMFSSKSWSFIYSKFNSKSSGFDPDKVSDQLKKLNQVVMEEYIRQMKKCIVLKEMQDPANFAKFAKLKVPIRINKKTAPYFGVVLCHKYEFKAFEREIARLHWWNKPEVAQMSQILANKCIEFQQHRFMQTNKKVLKLPQELEKLKNMQDAHHQAIKQNIKLQWREYLLGEMNKALNQTYNFYSFDDIRVYESHELKGIIVRFEQILNTFLREFVQTSINDWVGFVKNYTVPKYDKGELWNICTEPMVTINLHIKSAKKDRKKRSKKKEGDAPDAPEDPDEVSTINYQPSLEACEEYMLSVIDQMVASNNEFTTLEAELFRFLKMEERPNFDIPRDEAQMRQRDLGWIVDAKQEISRMVRENMVGPQALLEEYKKYEFVLNVDERDLLESLFDVPEMQYSKQDLETIRAEIERFYNAEEEILNISNNHIDYPMFRVKAQKMKTELARKAASIRKKIMKKTYDWCTKSVETIESTYKQMELKILSIPPDEKALVEIKEFIDVSKKKTKIELEELWKTVNRHMNMLDDFSDNSKEGFMFETDRIEELYYLKSWPLRIDAALGEGAAKMEEQTTTFTEILNREQDEFKTALLEYKKDFDQIREFTDLAKTQEFSKIASRLQKNLDEGFSKIENFNYRERLFGQKESEWPDLKTISDAFKPFGELITTCFELLANLKDWTEGQLCSLEDTYEYMDQTVSENFGKLTSLNKRLADTEYATSDAVAEVAMAMRGRLDEFRNNLQMISCIKSEALTQEDWQLI